MARPQKFAKAMFLHLSVSHSVHRGGVCLSACWGTPPGQTPLRSRHPRGGDPSPEEQTPPCTVHAGRYRQQVGGTLPTEMHTC